jgi:hypothetical protein
VLFEHGSQPAPIEEDAFDGTRLTLASVAKELAMDGLNEPVLQQKLGLLKGARRDFKEFRDRLSRIDPYLTGRSRAF